MAKGKKVGYVLVLISLVFLFGNMFFVSAITGSMGNARMILYPTVDGHTSTIIEKSILVNNVNNVSINVTLKSDDNATKFIQLEDDSFILGPGESKKAAFRIQVKDEGKYEGKVNVYFAPAEGTGPGVVLSSTVIVIAKGESADNTGSNTNSDSQNNSNSDSTNETGGVTGNSLQGNPGGGFNYLWISSAVLLAALAGLIYLGGKKRDKSKKSKKK